MSLPRIRTVPTASGATAVQVIWRYDNRKPVLDHIGSAHTDDDLALLMAKARQRIDGDQHTFDFGIPDPTAPGTETHPLPVIGERAGHILDAIRTVFTHLKLDHATGGDRVFYDLVTARLLHPGSKKESIETLAEVGVQSASYATIKRHLPRYATPEFRERITAALARHAGIGPGVFVLYDVTTLYFETDHADELRKPGFSKERRIEPQITVGMLTDSTGLPLSIGAFEGNQAETRTMLPMIRQFMAAYRLDDVTIVADAGMFSASNKQAIVDEGLGYILGAKTSRIPDVIAQWRSQYPGREYTDGQIWTQSHTAGRSPGGEVVSVTYYQYSQDRARRSLRGIDEQVDKAERAVSGKIPVKRNKYVALGASEKKVDYRLAEKHRALAGIKGYETNRVMPAEQVISAYRMLLKIEKSFRMAKSDLKARPIYHRKHESIDAHVTIVMTAMACGHTIEQATGVSLKRFVRTLRKYRSFILDVNGQHIHAHTPLPPDVAELIRKLPKSD